MFIREWKAFLLSTVAKRHQAIMVVTNAVAAVGSVPGGMTLRVDNGTQYTSRDFRASMKSQEITLEYIFVNTPEQNGHAESFHHTLKKEYVGPREFADINEAREAIAEAFEDYNHHRIHSSIGYLTPAEFAEAWRKEHAGEQDGKGIIGGEKCE